MPLVSKAQRRWAYANAKKPGRTGDAARHFLAASSKNAKLPERVKPK